MYWLQLPDKLINVNCTGEIDRMILNRETGGITDVSHKKWSLQILVLLSSKIPSDNTTMKSRIILSLLVLAAAVSCSKEQNDPVETGLLELQFEHQIDGDPLEMDNTFYTNAAGNQYRVILLKYFISGVTLFSKGKVIFRQSSTPSVISANHSESCGFTLAEVPAGDYDSISFSLGVVPELNYDDAFPLGYDDLGMYWPTSMGGGYHFMRFEGHWKDGDQYGGFAFHIGQNENLITTGFPLQLSIASAEPAQLDFVMNLNQWFEDPHFYDLKVESGYTMGDTVKMNMLVENGHRVFTLK